MKLVQRHVHCLQSLDLQLGTRQLGGLFVPLSEHIVQGVAILLLGRNDIDLNVHRKSTVPPEPNSLEVHNRFDILSCTHFGTEQVFVISDVNFGNCILWEGLQDAPLNPAASVLCTHCCYLMFPLMGWSWRSPCEGEWRGPKGRVYLKSRQSQHRSCNRRPPPRIRCHPSKLRGRSSHSPDLVWGRSRLYSRSVDPI